MPAKKDKLLGVAAVITFIIGSINAAEYFLAGKDYLYKKTAIVEKVTHALHENRKGILYEETTIWLQQVKGKFYVYDKADDGGHVEVEKGDTITVYARKLLQPLYNYDYRSNLFYVEGNGRMIYNNLAQWKAPAFTYMCISLGCSLFLLIMYLDQVKNVSISNWWQQRMTNKKKNEG